MSYGEEKAVEPGVLDRTKNEIARIREEALIQAKEIGSKISGMERELKLLHSARQEWERLANVPPRIEEEPY